MEGLGVDIQRQLGEVVAHEESVVGRQYALIEYGERSLELGRACRQTDQRTLLRVFHERTIPVGKRQVDRGGERRQGSAGQRRQPEAGGAAQKFTTTERGFQTHLFL